MRAPILDWLAQRASVLPGHAAVVAGECVVSYRELEARVADRCRWLRAKGVERGEHVGLLATNCLEFVEAVHALPRLGAVLVPLNARLTAEEIAWQIGDAGIARVLTVAASRQLAGAACRDGEAIAIVLERDGGSPVPAPAAEGEQGFVFEHDAGDAFAVIYTSGTTGRPKGAVLTYGNFLASAAASAFNIGVDPGDRWVACMPLFHVGGLSILVRSVIYGTTVVLHAGFDERAVNRELRYGGATLLSVVPTMLERMLAADEDEYPRSLRAVLVGGGPCPRPLLERALRRGLPVLPTYGLTEATSQVTTLAPADALAKVGSAGKPLPGTRLRVDAAPGEPGEVLVAGPTVMAGYLRQPQATAEAVREGWLRTGDIGRIDEEGYLWVLDRRDDLVVSGGENVYPAEVEAALREHPSVAGAAVVGLPDAHWGQVVVAVVVPRGQIGEAELTAHCRGRLAGYKVPRRFAFVDGLPATASGKVQRGRVREALVGAGQRQAPGESATHRREP